MSLHAILAEALSGAHEPSDAKPSTRRDARLPAISGKVHAEIGMRRHGNTTASAHGARGREASRQNPFETGNVPAHAFLKGLLVLLAGFLSTKAMGSEAVPLEGGLLYSDTGLPAADLTVTLSLKGYWKGEEHLSWSTSTNSKGRFEIPDLLPRRTYAITVRGAGYPVFQPIDLVTVGSVRRRIAPIPIPPARCHTGRIVDEGGKPVGGARVSLLFRRFIHPSVGFPHSFEGEFVRVYETASDTEGRCSFWALVTDSEGIVKATLPGCAPALAVLRPSTTEPIQLCLGRATEVSGRVTDTWGKPLSGQAVVAAPRIPCGPNWIALLSSRTLSRADGSFTLSGIRPDHEWNIFPANPVRGVVWKGGAAQEGLDLIADSEHSEEDPDDGSGQTARFLGKVLDAASGKPIEGAEIQLWPPSHGKYAERGTATGPDGSFEVRDLHPSDPWLLWVRAPGYAPAFDSVTLPGGDLEKSYHLEAVTPIRVICRDASGAPVANARIAMASHTSDLAHLYSRGTTNANGECILHERLPGRQEMVGIIASDDGCEGFGLPVFVEDGVAKLVLPGNTVRGSVKSATGQHLPGAEVSCGGRSSVFTDEHGVYVLERVGLGVHSIDVRSRKYSITQTFSVTKAKSDDLVLEPLVVRREGYLVQVLDDLGQPLAGVCNDEEVADGAGLLHVGVRDTFSSCLPFHQSAYVTRASMMIEDEDIDVGRLHEGINRIVLGRRGRILIRFEDSIARRLQHAFEEIEVDGPQGRRPRSLDRTFRIVPGESGIVLSRLAPGRWTVHFRRLGPYLPFDLADIEVKALQTTVVDASALIPGATLIVDLGKWPEPRRYPICTSLDDNCRFTCKDAKGNTRIVLGRDAGQVDREEYVIEGLPGAGQLDLAVTGSYPVTISVDGLEPGKEKKMAPLLDPWPVIRGKVLRSGGKQKRLQLCFSSDKSGHDSTSYEDIAEDGEFAVSLPEGVYSISAVIPVSWGSMDSDPDGFWKVLTPESVIVKRSGDVVGVRVTVEWMPPGR